MVFQNVTVAQVTLPLPDSNTFFQQAYDLAWPQVLAFSAAVVGVLAVSLTIKAFSRGS